MDDQSNDNQPHALFDTKFADWIDRRIDNKIDPKLAQAVGQLKLWIFGGLIGIAVANAIPSIYFIYDFGQFRGTLEQRLGEDGYTQREHEVYSQEVNRRFNETNARIDRKHPE